MTSDEITLVPDKHPWKTSCDCPECLEEQHLDDWEHYHKGVGINPYDADCRCDDCVEERFTGREWEHEDGMG